MGVAVAITAATTLGFFGGLLTFKVKTRWCADCGASKCCPRCAGWSATGVPASEPLTTESVAPSRRR
jgi:hypothetical protein